MRHEEDKVAELIHLANSQKASWMCQAPVKLRGRGAGVIVGVGNWENRWDYNSRGGAAHLRGDMMWDAVVFV